MLLLKSLLNKEKHYFKLFIYVVSVPAVEALHYKNELCLLNTPTFWLKLSLFIS